MSPIKGEVGASRTSMKPGPSSISGLLRRTGDEAHRDGGWGPPQAWPVPRFQGRPLVFQIRLPVAVELIDIHTLARQAHGAQSVGQGALELKRAAEMAGVVAVGALRPTTVPKREREILATIMVAFSEIGGPPAAEEFLIADSQRAVNSRVAVEKLSDTATRITRIGLESPGDGLEPAPMLVIQYLLHTSYGALVIAFSTTNQEMMGRWGRNLYRKIVEMTFIGERPRPC